MEQMVSEKQITLRSSSAGPGGPGFALEDAMVLIVGHFRDSSKQRIRFPNSDDCVCGKENSGRVEDPGEGFARMSSVPFIISTLSGIFGRDALTHEFKEVKWGEVCGDGSDEDCSVPAKDVTYDILLTVGFVPGLKVDAILLLRTIKIWR